MRYIDKFLKIISYESNQNIYLQNNPNAIETGIKGNVAYKYVTTTNQLYIKKNKNISRSNYSSEYRCVFMYEVLLSFEL